MLIKAVVKKFAQYKSKSSNGNGILFMDTNNYYINLPNYMIMPKSFSNSLVQKRRQFT